MMTVLPPAPAQSSGRLDLEPEGLRPGLLATYRSSIDKDATLRRIDLKPAFYLGASSLDRRLPPGPFEAAWTGVLTIVDPGPIGFRAHVGGEIILSVDGIEILKGEGRTSASTVVGKAPLDRKPGQYRIAVRYRSLPDVPARLQLWWEGPSFSAEPIPAWRLSHVVAERAPEFAVEEKVAAGRRAAASFGCARCHTNAFPGISDPPPGPSLADASRRLDRDWLLHWLENPAHHRPDAHMPVLFEKNREGFIERWLVAEHLAPDRSTPKKATGDLRDGRLQFIKTGCTACHFVPDLDRKAQPDLGRTALVGIGDRLGFDDLTAFLANPHGRYPDGRMPRLSITPTVARNLATYLLEWSKPSEYARVEPPTPLEIAGTIRRLKSRDATGAATTLLRDRGCTSCHPGLGPNLPLDVPIQKIGAQGCLSGDRGPRYALDETTRKALIAYLGVASREKHASGFAARQKMLDRAGCVRCHQRDTDKPAPLEVAGSTLGGAFLQEIPFQRTPRLSFPHQKFHRGYLETTLREGTSGLRYTRYTYRMPSFGADAETLARALAEGDGDVPEGMPAPQEPASADPTAATLVGPQLVGFQGYACVSCHVWDGQQLSQPDPGAIGTDLTRVKGRIRRDWLDRFLEAPHRFHPGTPMPAVFQKGKPATLASVLDGDSGKQRDALWSYLALGKSAPTPKPPPPMPLGVPAKGLPPIVAQIPIRLPDKTAVESLSIWTSDHDLLIYDLGAGAPHSFYTGARILRNVQGRVRQFLAEGTPLESSLLAGQPFQLVLQGKAISPTERTLLGFSRGKTSVDVDWRVSFGSQVLDVKDSLWIERHDPKNVRSKAGDVLPDHVERRLLVRGMPEGSQLEVRMVVPPGMKVEVSPGKASVASRLEGTTLVATSRADKAGIAGVLFQCQIPPAQKPLPWESKLLVDAGPLDGALTRSGYRAIAYPRPKTLSGEDRILPGSLAADPRDGTLFIASMKTGELLRLDDPTGDGAKARYLHHGGALFQDAFSMLAEKEGLFVLHRRNLSKVTGPDAAFKVERIAALPQGVADTYDYAYGLVRDRSGAFILSYAPYANQTMPGSGGSLRLVPGKKPEEVAYGFRNPVGWTSGPDNEVFFTDNQGEWVASNKLCHMVDGRFYGFPNPAQKQHVTKPFGKTAVWVPYGWARSINGATYDATGGKFGPFAGQFFLAELMYGGAIIRAQVEKVNGEYQGACFPFWERGLLGPVCLTFDPKGRLWVGSITEPGWMAQPDRGALFRIDYTGNLPFELRSIHVRPHGFRIVFTKPIDAKIAADAKSYRLEHYRYEYTGAYGSPELDRTQVKVERAEVAGDGLSVELTTSPLVKDRVYMIGAHGVRSAAGESLVHDTGAYTLNEVPK